MVVPANAGTHTSADPRWRVGAWAPACAGATGRATAPARTSAPFIASRSIDPSSWSSLRTQGPIHQRTVDSASEYGPPLARGRQEELRHRHELLHLIASRSIDPSSWSSLRTQGPVHPRSIDAASEYGPPLARGRPSMTSRHRHELLHLLLLRDQLIQAPGRPCERRDPYIRGASMARRSMGPRLRGGDRKSYCTGTNFCTFYCFAIN